MGEANSKAKEGRNKQGNDPAHPTTADRSTVFNRSSSLARPWNRKEGDGSNDSASSRSRQRTAQPETVATEGHGADSEKPWKNLEKGGTWDEKYKKKLIEKICSLDINDKEIKNIRILLIGPIKSGKSSFLNTIASIDNERITQVTVAGGAGKSVSKKLKVFRPRKCLKNFRLLDTMGIEETELAGFNIQDLVYVIKGNVPPDYKFNPASPIDEDDTSFKKEPKSKDKAHCVVFVVDANVVGHDNISDKTREKVNALQEKLMDFDIPRMVLLTKIDEFCEMTKNDITACYRSEAIKNAVDLAQDLFNLPMQNIFPVQNYSFEEELEAQKDILSLLALKQMLFFGTDFIKYRTTSDDEDSS